MKEKKQKEKRFVTCAGCGRAIPEGAPAIRRRGYTGFWCSARCFLSDTGFGFLTEVTDALVKEDREVTGQDWEMEGE